MKRKLISLSIVASMLVTLLTGCGNTPSSVGESASVSTQSGTVKESTSSAASEKVEEAISYPLEGNIKLKVAIVNHAAVSAISGDISETPFAAEWEKQTGVDIEWIVLENQDALALMFADGDLPDIVINSASKYSGGVEGAIADKVIEPLTYEEMEKWAPDLLETLQENDYARKLVTTNDGKIIGFPFIRGDEYLQFSNGLICRADWLEKLNMEVPTTLDEFEAMLVAFKEKMGAQYPISAHSDYLGLYVDCGSIMSAFGIPTSSAYQVNGEYHLGYAEPEYKEALAWLHKLYEQGLIDPNLSAIATSTMNANFCDGISGVVFNSVGGGIGTYMSTMQDVNPEYDLVAIPSLVAKEGDRPMYGYVENVVPGNYGWITSQCKDREAAMKFLNFGYTEAGGKLMNYGVEGVSYNMVDNYPTYTDLILNNSDGLTVQQAMAQYSLAAYVNGPFVQQKEYMEQYAARPQQKAAIETWMDCDALDYIVPALSIQEDADEFSKIGADITSYKGEMFIKFITGAVSLEDYESVYLKTLEEMGVKRYIEIAQKALDAFNAK